LFCMHASIDIEATRPGRRSPSSVRTRGLRIAPGRSGVGSGGEAACERVAGVGRHGGAPRRGMAGALLADRLEELLARCDETVVPQPA
jgi:hypothetical protein